MSTVKYIYIQIPLLQCFQQRTYSQQIPPPAKNNGNKHSSGFRKFAERGGQETRNISPCARLPSFYDYFLQDGGGGHGPLPPGSATETNKQKQTQVGKCSTRGGSRGMYITFASAKNAIKAEPTVALKPGGDVTRNPKQGYSGLKKRTCVRQKLKKKHNNRQTNKDKNTTHASGAGFSRSRRRATPGRAAAWRGTCRTSPPPCATAAGSTAPRTGAAAHRCRSLWRTSCGRPPPPRTAGTAAASAPGAACCGWSTSWFYRHPSRTHLEWDIKFWNNWILNKRYGVFGDF